MLRIANLAFFWKELAGAERAVLFLDYDGTLAPFREEREKASPYPGVVEWLDTIMAAGHTRLVMVSGRDPVEVLTLLGLSQPLEVWGSHGLERRFPDGAMEKQPLSSGAEEALVRAGDIVRLQGWEGGLEIKHGCVALHWRGLKEVEIAEREEELTSLWTPLLSEGGLKLAPFDGGLELRSAGSTKGDAVRTVLAEERPAPVAAYLGDDFTDEDGFLALGERGLTVLVRRSARRTAAAAWLRPPAELLEFLARWAQVRHD
jgi:trehalose-phosphatase